jgi:hypothetical protein
MRWMKQGPIFAPCGQGGWINSHAQMPVVHLRNDCLRIYFSTRPCAGVSLPAFIDVDLLEPASIRRICERPLLELGPPGSFDEHGIMPTMVIERDGELLLYYTGWSRLAGEAPYNNSSGLAVSLDGGDTFKRHFAGPVLSRTSIEPFSATLSWIVRDASVWHMWYSTTTEWVPGDSHLEPLYLIAYARSRDGIEWIRTGKPIIPSLSPHEAQSRPTILFRNGVWHMWFCYRGSRGFRSGPTAYRLGYARSTDLVHWERDDAAAGLDISTTGWDAQMIAYPCVVDTPVGVLMLYNGNDFGASGIGWAKLEG